MTGGAGQRIDLVLWHARIVRTRADAAALARAGRVRVNGARVTGAARLVRLGDVITVALHGGVRVVRLLGFAARRGRAEDARALIEDVPETDEPGQRGMR
ncbi:S4 domain-containing protein [Blastochloris sulfoviridis]|uniref:RNA-binding S4 domain-containing protein n=1 Tax=Blastochloris sulfoviridis TaxID=50712 RepID=A0A5M6I507_9HYPH|nr:S4 domain-containing protein [Blastochloris sulfoviridis]KAA5603294.1 RNA-binding S4 domain-containing protein [Blastochloris sulfoviridis]